MKQLFVLRTLSFLKSIRFSSSNEIRLTFEIEVMVASAFIQITFGLKRHHLSHFNSIYNSHQPYVYKQIGVPYYGDTNLKTARINLVWSVVQEGFLIPDDALNLSIHEFSHALTLDNKKRTCLNRFYPQQELVLYFQAAKREIHNIRNGKDSIFRPYGATNLMEFFAVSVEVFFEQTKRFAIEQPVLFERLCLLLLQDPRKPGNPRL